MTTNLGPWPGNLYPPVRAHATANITPFTYYDGLTFLEILSELRKWLSDILLPGLDGIIEIIDGMIQDALENVEIDLEVMREELNDALASIELTDKELRAYVDDVLQQVINNSIQVSDPVIAGVLEKTDSQSRALVSAIANPRVIFVDDFKRFGDLSDTESWQRAVDYAVAQGDAFNFTITGRKDRYELHDEIILNGLNNATLMGGLTNPATIVGQVGGGDHRAFYVENRSGETVSTQLNVLGDSLLNMNVWGGFDPSVTTVPLNVAGNGSTEAAVRFGAINVSVTLADNVIPVSGGAVITALDPVEQWRNVQVQWEIAAELEGITGTFLFPSSSFEFGRFVPDTVLDAPVTVPAGSPLTILEDVENSSGIGFESNNMIVWLGRNSTQNYDTFTRDMDAIMTRSTGANMVVSVTNGSNEPSGTHAYARVMAMNEYLESTFPDEYWDARSWLNHECIYAMHITPTVDDLENMGADCPPPSIMNDNYHPSAAAYNALGVEMERQAKMRGVIATSGAVRTGNLRFTNFDFDGSATYPEDGVFDRRQDNIRSADRINDAIHMNGNLRPSGGDNPVDNIEIDHCSFIGIYTLPVHLKGCSNIDMHDNFIKRSLDTGFTFSRAVKFYNNRVEWSSDNGVSISRGCSEIVISGNNIVGSYYAGIHVGGFGNDAGPEDITITGNTVLQSRQYGISAINGSKRVTITGNTVDGVLRGAPSENRDTLGDRAPVAYGSGIIFGGRVTGETTPNATVHDWCEDVLVVGNIVKNCDRMGILAKGGTRRPRITGNTVIDVGSAMNASGSVSISPTHRYYNIGISAYSLSSDLVTDGVASDNTIVDTRSNNLTNYGVLFLEDLHNVGARLRNAQRLGLGSRPTVGDGVSTAALFIDGPSSKVVSQVFQGDGESLFSIRKSLSDALEVYMYGSDISVPLKFHRSTGQMVLDLPTISDVTGNLYVDQYGVLRKIV